MAKNRFKSIEDYQHFQSYQADAVYGDLKRIFNISNDSFFVDWGCGSGGYTKYFATKFKNILGIDFLVPKNIEGVKFIKNDLTNYVINKKADIIFCASVIEHVENQKQFVSQISKNLKVGGYLYLSFPPFYSIGGGHQLKPFHYLPEKLAIKIGKKLRRISNNVYGYTNLFDSWGLYITSIKKVRQILINNRFEIKTCKTRFVDEKSLFNTARIPVLNEFLTWHVEFYCIKK